MRGRGLLIAAAVIQLVGAGLFLVSGLGQLAIGVAHGTSALVGVGAAGAGVALVYAGVSVALLLRRRWAWIASLALDGLSALSLFALPLAGRVGLGELVILVALLGAPIFVTIGLLIGGRRAVSSSTKTAAASSLATPSSGA